MPVRFAAPCERCGSLYLEGSSTTCARCSRYKGRKKRRWLSGQRLRCDCGKTAIAIILVWVGYEELDRSEERIPVCRDCLIIEEETQAMLDRLGGYQR